MFEEIKDAVSTREAASFYGLKIGRGGMTCCPFHNDKHPSMKVDARFHCFGCGADGDVINFVQQMFLLDAKQAAFKLIDDFHLNIDTGRKESRHEKDQRIRLAKQKEREKNIRMAYAEELRDFRERWQISIAPCRPGNMNLRPPGKTGRLVLLMKDMFVLFTIKIRPVISLMSLIMVRIARFTIITNTERRQ